MFVLSLLVACQEYHLVWSGTDESTERSTQHCEFFVERPIVGGYTTSEPDYASVQPMLWLVTPSPVNVARGEELAITYAVNSMLQCGDLELTRMNIAADTYPENWASAVRDADLPGWLKSDVSDEFIAQDTAASEHGAPSNLFGYEWYAEDAMGGFDGANMPPQHIGSNDIVRFTFSWMLPDFAPDQSEFTVSLPCYGWRDPSRDIVVEFCDSDLTTTVRITDF